VFSHVEELHILEARTRNWRQAREKACEQVTSSFDFRSDWLVSGASFSDLSQGVVEENQSKRKFILPIIN